MCRPREEREDGKLELFSGVRGSSQSVVLPRHPFAVPKFVLGLVRERWEVRWCFQCQQLLQGKGIREEEWDRKAKARSSADILPL